MILWEHCFSFIEQLVVAILMLTGMGLSVFFATNVCK